MRSYRKSRTLETGLFLVLAAGTCAMGATPVLAWASMGASLCLLALFVRRPSLAWWPATVVCYVAISIFSSEIPARSVFFATQWIAWFSAFLLGSEFAGSRFRNGWIAFAVLQSLYGLLQYLGDHDYILWVAKTKYLNEATGTFINHNHFAGFLAMALPLTLAAAVKRFLARDGAAPLFILGVIVELLAVVFSRSRAGLACAVFAVAAFGLLVVLKTRNARLTAMLGLAVVAVLGYGLWIGFGPVQSRFELMAESGYLQTEGRLAIWRDTLELVRAKPWFGWGPGTFPSVYPSVRTEPTDVRWMEAHNDYLQFTAELGVVGAALFFVPLWWLIASLAVRAWQAPGQRGITGGAIAVSLAAILLHSAVDFHLYVPANAAWIMALAGMAAAERDSLRVEISDT